MSKYQVTWASYDGAGKYWQEYEDKEAAIAEADRLQEAADAMYPKFYAYRVVPTDWRYEVDPPTYNAVTQKRY